MRHVLIGAATLCMLALVPYAIFLFAMAPKCRGIALSNEEVAEFADEKIIAMRQIAHAALNGDTEMASRMAGGAGFLDLKVNGSRSRGDVTISLLIYEQTDVFGTHQLSLDYPWGEAKRLYESMSPDYGSYTRCIEGWWIVRH